jgi:DUF4097 and DUF4098 domain-containing protein YvlB
MSPRYSLALLIVIAPFMAGCDETGNGDVTAGQSGTNTINGAVRVPAGEHSGAVGTVNGSITIEDQAAVASASTVNGRIEMGAHASAEALSTVNGRVALGEGAHVTGGVTTVNGSISLNRGADVGGSVRNVNGHITLDGAHVAGGLKTVSADIDITGGSRLEGGILVQKSTGSWFGFAWHTHKPRVLIGPGAVVQGPLHFQREVLLYVSDQASVIGPTEGATVIRFSGAKPPG